MTRPLLTIEVPGLGILIQIGRRPLPPRVQRRTITVHGVTLSEQTPGLARVAAPIAPSYRKSA